MRKYPTREAIARDLDLLYLEIDLSHRRCRRACERIEQTPEFARAPEARRLIHEAAAVTFGRIWRDHAHDLAQIDHLRRLRDALYTTEQWIGDGTWKRCRSGSRYQGPTNCIQCGTPTLIPTNQVPISQVFAPTCATCIEVTGVTCPAPDVPRRVEFDSITFHCADCGGPMPNGSVRLCYRCETDPHDVVRRAFGPGGPGPTTAATKVRS